MLVDSERDFLLQFPGMSDEDLDAILGSAAEVAENERADEEQARLEADRAHRAAEVGRHLQEILGLDEEGRLRKVRGLGESSLKQLLEADYQTVEKVAEATVEDLALETGISEKKAKQLKYAATQWIKHEVTTREEADECGLTVVDGVVRLPGETEEVAQAEQPSAVGDSDEGTQAEQLSTEGGPAQPTPEQEAPAESDNGAGAAGGGLAASAPEDDTKPGVALDAPPQTV
jgi:hypothetical protein